MSCPATARRSGAEFRPSLASFDDILAFAAHNADAATIILSGGRIRDDAIRRGRGDGDGASLSADAADAALLAPPPASPSWRRSSPHGTSIGKGNLAAHAVGACHGYS